MIFKFGKGKKLSDVLKVATFLEKEGIEYEMLSDITVAVGPNVDQPGEAATPAYSKPAAPIEDDRVKQTPQQNDPLWRAKVHDDKLCSDFSCKHNAHYGAEPL